ncbi:cobalt ABC transporter ATP-binding protein [Ornatilinea apprima]|uniref:Cobalt ABC transporter ATP-binding protein n=1 Tax=Ornatilinea apprima TaxID=1134406 RepID=A0A0P6Y9G4_9CHLR|nr:ABC transporter ATP-binding protein [Ornatilinea apprima]KPL78412.1 cobalt ABC transporter ATP-binding protein [Ornatilinea apprima]
MEIDSTFSHVIEITRLNYTYPDGRQALHDLSLQVSPGEKVALIGANGAGKSTLLLHLNGILNGDGALRVAGMELTQANLPRVRALVGMVFQSPDDQLFSPTVFEDVAYGPVYQGLPPAEIEQRVRTALEAVGMDDFARRSSYHLSIGEKKRIALATVLSMQPQVLALDEPSAGLDPRARRELIHLLKEMPQTMLVATHDLALARDLLPRTVLLHKGRVVADGPTEKLLDDETLLLANGL